MGKLDLRSFSHGKTQQSLSYGRAQLAEFA